MLEPKVSHKTFALSDSEIDFFRMNGYIGPFDLYEPDEIKRQWRKERLRLLDRSNAVYQDDQAISGANNISNYDRHLDNTFLSEHICRPEIVDRVVSLLNKDVLCWRTEFFPKYPGDEGTDWHQADTFANAGGEPQILWPESADFGGTITVWTAFSDTDKETACLQFIPGTHEEMHYDESKQMYYDPEKNSNLQKGETRRGFFGYDYRELQKDPNWKPDESMAVSLEMKAGQFIVFWSTLMHASHPHVGKVKTPRIGFTARYVPSQVKVYPGLSEIHEYGGQISLENFGSVVVSGENRDAGNRIRTTTMTGVPFNKR